MVKLMRHKQTSKLHVIEIDRYGKMRQNKIVNDKQEAIVLMRKWNLNASKRLQNNMLRDLCGTSARQARLDMGL